MRYYLKIFLCLCILLTSIHCQSNGKKPSAAVQEWTEVASNGETVVTASYAKYNIRVIIKTHKIEKSINEPWDKKLSPVPATCIESSWCSLVDKLEIIVNGKQIRIPQSIVSRLASLNEAKIRMDGVMMLLLTEGDAAEAELVKIEFDDDHVTKMSIFVDISGDHLMARNHLLHEETYP